MRVMAAVAVMARDCRATEGQTDGDTRAHSRREGDGLAAEGSETQRTAHTLDIACVSQGDPVWVMPGRCDHGFDSVV